MALDQPLPHGFAIKATRSIVGFFNLQIAIGGRWVKGPEFNLRLRDLYPGCLAWTDYAQRGFKADALSAGLH